MGDLQARTDIKNASKKRVSAINFGEPITNICAGENNPSRHSFFVEYKIKSHKNKYGVTHNEQFAKCTDGKGSFWYVDINVIHPGHLDADKCKELFDPVWQAQYGE